MAPTCFRFCFTSGLLNCRFFLCCGMLWRCFGSVMQDTAKRKGANFMMMRKCGNGNAN